MGDRYLWLVAVAVGVVGNLVLVYVLTENAFAVGDALVAVMVAYAYGRHHGRKDR